MTALGVVSTVPMRPGDLIIAARAAAIIAKLPTDLAVALVGVDPRAVEAYAEMRAHIGLDYARLAVRNDALRALSRAGLSAADIEREMVSYEANGWVRDRLKAEMPARYAGRYQENLWLAFKCYPSALKRRRIAQIIENIDGEWQSNPCLDCQKAGS